jgi:hypothetical protein
MASSKVLTDLDFGDVARALNLPAPIAENEAATRAFVEAFKADLQAAIDEQAARIDAALEQIALRQLLSERGAPSGYPPLGPDGIIPIQYLPESLPVTSVVGESAGEPYYSGSGVTGPDVRWAGIGADGDPYLSDVEVLGDAADISVDIDNDIVATSVAA